MDFKKLLQPKFLIIGGIAVIGGLFLASRLRPKETSTEEQTVVATPVLQPYGVDRNPDEYRADAPTTSPAPPGVPQPANPGTRIPLPAQPPTTPPTTPPVVPVPRPPVPLPEMPRKGLPVPVPTPTLPGTPRRDVPPAPPSAPPSNPNVPGNVPSDCRGVQPRPADHPGANVAALVSAKGGGSRGRALALEWVYLGIANSGATGLSRFTQWINQPVVWSRVNMTRRSRGLRAYTETELKTLVNELHQLNALNRGQDSKFSDEQLQTLWNRWHIPYLCS